MLAQMFIFAMVGLGLEVVFTGVLDGITHRRKLLMGYSSVWYVPFYAAVPWAFERLWPYLVALPWFTRGAVYVVLFHVGEYLAMGLLRLLLGQSPSEESYRKSAYNIHALTRLDFAPAFFVMGMLFEWLWLATR
ncbi:MAG: hypothetical protein AB2A00_11525 [Myxococcota bacterium]